MSVLGHTVVLEERAVSRAPEHGVHFHCPLDLVVVRLAHLRLDVFHIQKTLFHGKLPRNACDELLAAGQHADKGVRALGVAPVILIVAGGEVQRLQLLLFLLLDFLFFREFQIERLTLGGEELSQDRIDRVLVDETELIENQNMRTVASGGLTGGNHLDETAVLEEDDRLRPVEA